MDQLKGLSLGRRIILGGAVLLLIDSFLDWQQVSFLGHSLGQSAWHGFWGVMIGLLTVVLILWVAARAFGVALPANVPDGIVTLAVAAVIVLFALIKILNDAAVHWPAYVGLILGVVVAGGAWLNFQASGESLPRMPMATAGAGSGGGTTSAPVDTPAATTDDEPPASSGTV